MVIRKPSCRGKKVGARRERPTGTAKKHARRAASAAIVHFRSGLKLSCFDGMESDCVVAEVGGQPPGSAPVARRDAAARNFGRSINMNDVARLLAVLGHVHRLTILATLLASEATHQSLVKATGLKAGPLYHHLRELREQGLIGPKTRCRRRSEHAVNPPV